MNNLSAFEPMSLRDAVNRLFEDSFVRPEMLNATNRGLAMDVLETPDHVVVKVNIPGAAKDQVDVNFQKDTLTIKANVGDPVPQGESPKERYLLRERFNGQLSRSVTLPMTLDVDKASARFENGVLTLTLPKSEATKPRTIKVTE